VEYQNHVVLINICANQLKLDKFFISFRHEVMLMSANNAITTVNY